MIMSDLQIFRNENFGAIRILSINGKPYFVGKDISNILGYRNGSRDINRHVDEDDRIVKLVFDGRQYKNTICINESGLYSLILSSKLPKAKEFKHWVTAEVLPSIRQTGGYGQIDIEKIVSLTVSETIKQFMPLLQAKNYDYDEHTEEITIKKRVRKKAPGIIEKLPNDLRKVVDDMLCDSRYTYQDIINMLADEGINLSAAAVSRYARRYF